MPLILIKVDLRIFCVTIAAGKRLWARKILMGVRCGAWEQFLVDPTIEDSGELRVACSSLLCPQCWNSIVHGRGPTRCWESRNISLRILEIAMRRKCEPLSAVGFSKCMNPSGDRMRDG